MLRWLYRNVYTHILPDYIAELGDALEGCTTVLDVGCGASSPLGSVPRKFHSTGVDIHAPSLKKSKEAGTHSNYRRMNVLEVGAHFKPRSFDAVVALDVIEHFEKKQALRLIQQMEKLAKKRVILFTPNGFLPQGEYDENPWQVHRSGWEVEEMAKLGYRVIGINGWKPFRGEYAEIKFWPKYFWMVISDITQRAVRNAPKHAFALLCIKEVK